MQAHNHTTPDTTRARLKGHASRSVAQALPAATADPGRLKAAARWSRGKQVATRPADLMEGRNPKTGARIVGTAAQISATSSVQFDAFTRGEDGRLEYEHTGFTEIHYDGRRPGGGSTIQRLKPHVTPRAGGIDPPVVRASATIDLASPHTRGST